MGVFGKLFGKKATAVVEAPPCVHTVLVPRWENVQDMGKEDKASRWMCEACHQMFTPEEAKALREQSVAERLVGNEAVVQASGASTAPAASAPPSSSDTPATGA